MSNTSNIKNYIFYFISILILIILIEITSILAIHFRYISHNTKLSEYNYSATIFIIKRTIKYIRSGGGKYSIDNDFKRVVSKPEPFLVPDELHGYIHKPGKYKITFRKKKKDDFETHTAKVTINESGYRYVGNSNSTVSQNIYIFRELALLVSGP